MASYTGNLNLKKPALDDDALITDINNNMDILDAAVNGIQDGLAIVANGNTHVAITSGQFVYVRNHGTLTEGLYVASTNIAANATLSTSNLTADSAGGLNTVYASLNSNLANKQNIFHTQSVTITCNTQSNLNGIFCGTADVSNIIPIQSMYQVVILSTHSGVDFNLIPTFAEYSPDYRKITAYTSHAQGDSVIVIYGYWD